MNLPLAETVSFPAGTGWAVPGFQELFDSVLKYFGSAWPMWCLFFIGIWLGYLIFGRKRSRTGDSTREAPEEAAVSETEPPGERESKERQRVAELEGELSAARKMGDQQRLEMEGLQARFESARRELDEKQDRFTELSESLKEAASQPAGQASLAHARAPVIHLDEVVRRERRHLEWGLSRLQHLEDRLTAENGTVWRCVERVAAIQDEIRHDPAASDGPARELVRKTGVVDEHLRVFHQNAQGCLQGIAGSKSRLRSEETKLEQASALVARAEAALAGLAATEDRTDGAAIKAAFSEASARLLESRPIIESLENGIDQEIAEMTGRIDWVARDSPKSFLKALEELNRCEAPESAEIAEKASEIRRLLNEAKSAPAGVELALSTDAGGEPEHRCGKRAILEAFDRSVKTLESTATTPVGPTEPAEAENTIAHLERQLFLRECETKRLDRELKSRTRELRQFRQEKEQRGRVLEAAVLPGRDAPGGNFVRRLLGFGSGGIQSGIEQPAPFSDSLPETEAPAATLAEAREILSELKLTSSHGSGNGDAEPDSTKKDVPPSESNPPPSREAEPELTRLRDRTTRQQSRIDELEKTIAELGKAGIASLQIDPFLKPDRPEPPGRDAAETGLVDGVTPGDRVEADERELVIFRGTDLGTWDTEFRGADGQFSLPLESVPADLRYLRLRRLDNGDSVAIPMTREELLEGASAGGKGYGWSGKRERYFGGDHFGIYDESLPCEVETKFGCGGWGFGHVEGIGSEQAYGWAGRRIDPTGFEVSVGTESPVASIGEGAADAGATGEPEGPFQLPETGLIVFRSNNPEIWDQNTYSGANCRSREIAELPEDIAWLRIRWLPRGESIILAVTRGDLSGNGDGMSRGFNGSNEFFYGARHLGAFDDSLPQEVETRFTYGGWGFGHSPTGPEEQACGWEGREIDRGTVFEFTVYREMPEVDPLLDRVLKA